MNPLLTALIAIFVFGILILIHELGHFISARIFKVTINEFSIGMGPRIFSRTSKKTGIKYSLAALPIGGFVAMAGEADESDDPNSFDKKPAWQRFIITAAGAVVNIVAGFLVTAILTMMIPIGNTTVTGFLDLSKQGYEVGDVTTEGTLQVGDKIIRVDGKRVRIYDELNYEIMRRAYEPIDLTVKRDGEVITLENVVFPTVEQDGVGFGLRDFTVAPVEKHLGNIITFSWSKATLIVRMCWESVVDLITGRYSLSAVSGPVGVSTAIGDAAKAGFEPFLYMFALISINLGVMNLLPIPALDGGRLLSTLVEMITRKKLPAKIENMINCIGLVLLLGLSLVIMLKDIFQLIF